MGYAIYGVNQTFQRNKSERSRSLSQKNLSNANDILEKFREKNWLLIGIYYKQLTEEGHWFGNLKLSIFQRFFKMGRELHQK